LTCKFAPKKHRRSKVVCSLYQSDAVTCTIDDGGPFVNGFSYCGNRNILVGLERNRALQSIQNKFIVTKKLEEVMVNAKL